MSTKRFSKEELLNIIYAKPIVPVFFNANVDHTKDMIRACYEGGVRAFEFTNRGEKAGKVFAELVPFVREEFDDLALGIGTIYDASTALYFLRLGADFLVQPCLVKEVGEVCHTYQVPWMPGAMTVNEIHQARIAGADVVKIFPGNVVGPEFVKSLRGPMPDVKLMVTGGVLPTVESVKEWFGAGVNAVGMGSQLFKDLEGGNHVISERLKVLFDYLA